MTKKLIFIFILISTECFSASLSFLVECSALIQRQNHKVTIRMNQNYEIIYFKRNHLISAPKDGPFYILAEDEEVSGVESVRSFKTPNGFSVAYGITTADSLKIGVNKDLSKGFYEYTDLGSGNGHLKTAMSCKKK